MKIEAQVEAAGILLPQEHVVGTALVRVRGDRQLSNLVTIVTVSVTYGIVSALHLSFAAIAMACGAAGGIGSLIQARITRNMAPSRPDLPSGSWSLAVTDQRLLMGARPRPTQAPTMFRAVPLSSIARAEVTDRKRIGLVVSWSATITWTDPATPPFRCEIPLGIDRSPERFVAALREMTRSTAPISG